MRSDLVTPTGVADQALLDLEFAAPPAPPPPPPVEPPTVKLHPIGAATQVAQPIARLPRDRVLDHLNKDMVEFVGRMEMAYIGAADAGGECDSRFRTGPAGFLHVLDERRIAYPEYRGNGVMASLATIDENPHVGLLLIDFVRDLVGLHVNGRARVVEDADLRREHPALPVAVERGRTPERWIVLHVEETYLHCRTHVPRRQPVLGDHIGVRARQNAPIAGPR